MSPTQTSTETSTHQPPPPIILRSAINNPFSPNSHSVSDLTISIVKYTQTRNPLQQSALNTYYTSSPRSAYILNPSTHFPDLSIITAYFQLFDALFFFSSLHQTCSVDLLPKTTEHLNNQTVTTFRFLPDGQTTSKITLHLIPDSQMSRKERLTTYLETLLHEMIHVFLKTYSCRCHSCSTLQLGAAKLGHGDPWMDIAFAIEKAVKRLLSLEVDLLRMWCLVTECCLSGPAAAVREMDVGRWGFEEGEIEGLVDELGARVRREKREGREFFEWAREWRRWCGGRRIWWGVMSDWESGLVSRRK